MGTREWKTGNLITQPRRSGEGCFGGDKAAGPDCHTLHIAVERMEIYLHVTYSFSRRRVKVEVRFTTLIEKDSAVPSFWKVMCHLRSIHTKNATKQTTRVLLFLAPECYWTFILNYF
jgi:hypothetical protein